MPNAFLDDDYNDDTLTGSSAPCGQELPIENN